MGSERSFLTPSLLDHTSPQCYIRLAFHFHVCQSTQSLLIELQTALEHTCRTIPWIGGSVYSTQHESGSKKEIVVRWGLGDSPTLADLGELPMNFEEQAASNMPLDSIPENIWPTPEKSDRRYNADEGEPVMFGGLAAFKGLTGVALCLCFHHSVVDAHGLTGILDVWSAWLCSMHPKVKTQEISDSRDARLRSALQSELTRASEMTLEELWGAHPEYNQKVWHSSTNTTRLAFAIMEISAAKVDSMKQRLAPYTTLAPSSSTIVCAILWSAVTAIRQERLSSQLPKDSISRLGHVANGRLRIRPSFSSSEDFYFGNCIFNALAELPVDLLTGPPELGATETMVLASLATICDTFTASASPDKINSKHIAEVYSIFMRTSQVHDIAPGWNPLGGMDMISTNWSNFDLYGISFGKYLGHAQFVRPAPVMQDGLSIILPRRRTGLGHAHIRDGESIEVALTLCDTDLTHLDNCELWKLIALQ